MKGILNSNWCKKTLFAIMIIVLLFLAIGRPAIVSSSDSSYIYSDKLLYEKYLNLRKTNPIWALMYIWAYIQRDPPVYLNNTDGFRDKVIGDMNNLIAYINDPLNNSTVKSHLKACGCYPCNKCQLKASTIGSTSSGLTVSETIVPPPDAAIVCVDSDYQGKCKVLSVGVYNTAEQIGLPNDTISSVLVGSKVKLTLYVHGGLTGEYITFTNDDPYLVDNMIDNTYTWNDNTTSLKVEWR